MKLLIGVDRSLKFAVLTLTMFASFSHMADVNAQNQASQQDCLEAVKLKLEAQALQDFLRPYAAGSQTFAGPSFPDHDSPNGDSMQEAMRDYLVTCRGGGTPTCDAYALARNAMFAGNPPDGNPFSAMHTDPVSCEIKSEKHDMEFVVTETNDAPAEGFERANWLYNFRHEESHETNCKQENIGNTDTEDSPFLRKMNDPSGLAIEEYDAYGVSQKVMETFLNKSCNVASMTSMGGGDSINMLFDRFPSRDILTMGGEVQARAGIEQPCMLRLNMTNTKTHEGFSLQMDNEGPIGTGDYQAADAVAPEKAAGNFISAFSFGRGRDRVSYRVENGTLELMAFTPDILIGKVQVFGSLPKRVYGQAESPWPQTMSVQTEFTLVPRVNMGMNVNAGNCFGQGE